MSKIISTKEQVFIAIVGPRGSENRILYLSG